MPWRAAVRPGTDHVVGLYAGHIQHGPAQGAPPRGWGNLAAQIVRHGVAVGLVLGVNLVAKGGALGIEHAGHVIRWVLFAQLVIMLMMMRMAPVFCTVPSGSPVLMSPPPAKKAR
jgi:hypothetical protein